MIWSENTIFLWVAAFLVAAWLLPRRWQIPAISVVGFAFMASSSVTSLLMIIILGTIGYILTKNSKLPGFWPTGIMGMVTLVAFVLFKIEIASDFTITQKILPLGMAYYSLRIIQFVLYAQQNRSKEIALFNYYQFLFFFPTFSAGPVNLFEDFIRDSFRRRWDWRMFSRGLERVIQGYAKIVILGNFISVNLISRWLTNLPADSWWVVYLSCVLIGFNLYMQFSGYSDIAIGLSAMAGFRVPENFRYPFLATNIQEFWRRWHMTVTNFFRHTIFLPANAITRNTVVSVIISMILVGLWHEISLRYLIWGIYHGIGIAVYQQFKTRFSRRTSRNKVTETLKKLLSWFVTFNYVVFSYAVIMADSFSGTIRIWQTILSFWR